jgi:FkbM family methyltransferase
MKSIIKKVLMQFGVELHRYRPTGVGSVNRPIGDVKSFLEDIRHRGFSPRGIIDVGANRGDWTLMALSVFPDASVLMIEPQEEMRPLLESVCHCNPKAEYILAGAASSSGSQVQTIWEDLVGSSFLPQVNQEKLRAGKQRVTKMVTIDEVLAKRPTLVPDLVKLDIQGFELQALAGASSTFRKAEVFVLETSLYQFMPNQPRTIDCIKFMADRGYDLYDVTEYLRRPLDGALGQIDLAFAKADGQLRKSSSWK